MHTNSEGTLQRRAFLTRATTLGLLALTPGLTHAEVVTQARGQVRLNGQPFRAADGIKAGDTITTGPDSQAIFAIGDNVFKVRENSEVTFEQATDRALQIVVELARGAMMAVFGAGAKRIRTGDAMLGVRGTGVYVEASRKHSYVCTCYGDTRLSMRDGSHGRDIQSGHHNPLFVYTDDAGNAQITQAPMMNHEDAELEALERLVGRTAHFR